MNAKITKLLELARSWSGLVEGPRPCIITIGRTSWPAVWYKQERDTPRGSRAHSEGERTYVTEAFYLLGNLPALKRRGNAAFPWAEDGREWYVAGYSPKTIKKEFRRYHKLGKNFLLMPWDVPGGEAIDRYERHPYKRAPMTVKWL